MPDDEEARRAAWYAVMVRATLLAGLLGTTPGVTLRTALLSLEIAWEEPIRGGAFTLDAMHSLSDWLQASAALATMEAWHGRPGPYRDHLTP